MIGTIYDQDGAVLFIVIIYDGFDFKFKFGVVFQA